MNMFTNNLLVSTSLKVVSIKEGIQSTIHSGKGCYYGLAQDKKFFYVAGRQGLKGEAHPTVVVKFCKSDFLPVDNFTIENCHDVHGIDVVGNFAYIISTGTADIFRLNVFTGEIEQKHLPTLVTECGEGRGSHLNTIKHLYDETFVFLGHRGPSSECSTLFKYNYTNNSIREIDTNLGEHSHSYLARENGFMVCNSFNGEIIEKVLPLRKLCIKKYHKINSNLLLRGLIELKDHFVLGLSQHSMRQSRHSYGTGLLRFYDKEFKRYKEISLGEVGQVNEILAL
tara:strand:- start:391 stop:1239 length:849 start_codon:yes stop_codon:yes gene_type:complete